MTVSAAGQVKRGAAGLQLKRGTTQLARADRKPELVAGDHVRPQPHQAEPRHAPGRTPLLDLDAREPLTVEAGTTQGLLHTAQWELDGPRPILSVHIVFGGLKVRIVRSGPHRRRAFGTAAAGGRIEDFGRTPVVGEHAARCRQRCRPRGGRCRTQYLAVRAVAYVEPVAPMATRIGQRVCPDRNRERLPGRIRGLRLAFASEHPRDVDFEWDGRDTSASDGADANSTATAGSFQLRVGDFSLGGSAGGEQADGEYEPTPRLGSSA